MSSFVGRRNMLRRGRGWVFDAPRCEEIAIRLVGPVSSHAEMKPWRRREGQCPTGLSFPCSHREAHERKIRNAPVFRTKHLGRSFTKFDLLEATEIVAKQKCGSTPATARSIKIASRFAGIRCQAHGRFPTSGGAHRRRGLFALQVREPVS